MNIENDHNIELTQLLHIQNQVLKSIRPTRNARKRLEVVIDRLFNEVNEIIKSKNIAFKLEPILVGSVAKDTFLNEPDIDLFIMFPKKATVNELREIGLDLARNILPNGEERYAEHPYLAGKFGGFDIDIVPCYKLVTIEEKMTAVDRTPLHTTYVMENITIAQLDEVRLLKQFMKGIGVYGAELEVQGFSGYLCELLILRYGDMLSLLEVAQKWETDMVLDLDKRPGQNNGEKRTNDLEFSPRTRKDLPKTLQWKFKDEPLIFIDPVDKTRNVASAVAMDKFELFKKAASEYLKRPKLEFYFPKHVKPLTQQQLFGIISVHQKPIIGLEIPKPDVIPEILYGQVRKCQRAVRKLLITSGFGVEYSDFYVNDLNNKILLLFELTRAKLPESETHTGPPEGHGNVNDFLAKWQEADNAFNQPYLKNKRWYVDIKRQYNTAPELLKAKISELSIGKQLNEQIKLELNIYQDKELLQPGLEEPLTKFLERRHTWEY